MTDFIAWVVALPSNPMFAGITGAAVISGVLVAARRAPAKLWQWALMAVSAQVTVKSQDPVFWGFIYLTTVRRMVDSESRFALDSLANVAYIRVMDASHPSRTSERRGP